MCGGVFFAAHFPLAERRNAIAVALVWAVVWLLYIGTWQPWSPHHFLHIRYSGYWSLLDLILGAIVAEKVLQHFWGLFLFNLSIAQILCHIAFSFNIWDFYIYSITLDYFFYTQAMVFFIYGAGGVGNRIIIFANSVRNALGKNTST